MNTYNLINSLNEKSQIENDTLIDNKKLTEVLLDYSPNFKCVVPHYYIQVRKLSYSAVLNNPKISGLHALLISFSHFNN